MSTREIPDGVRRIFAEGFRVADVAEPLASFDDATPAGDVGRFMDGAIFDVVGVRRGGQVWGFVERPLPDAGPCGIAAMPFDGPAILPDSAPLSAAVQCPGWLAPRVFVTAFGRVAGIVNVAGTLRVPSATSTARRVCLHLNEKRGIAMTWEQRYRLRLAARTSLVLWAGLSLVAALRLRPAVRWLDRQTGWVVFGFSPDGARAVLGALAGSMLTFIVFVLSATLIVVQLASGQLTPRVIAMVFAMPWVKIALGMFTFTYAYTLVGPRAGRGPGPGPARRRRRPPEPGVHRRVLPVRPAAVERAAAEHDDAAGGGPRAER